MIERLSVSNVLCEGLLNTDSLMKLVLQGIPMDDKSGSNLVKFIKQNVQIENVQIIDCNLPPYTIADILMELEDNQSLINLSLRNNVLRQHKSNAQVASSLAKISQAPYFLHLEISGMLLGSEKVLKIVEEGVSHSKTMLGFHFNDNRVDHWTRMRIH